MWHKFPGLRMKNETIFSNDDQISGYDSKKTVCSAFGLQGSECSQFHVRHDDFFETVRPSSQNPSTLSHWQALAGLKEQKDITLSEGAGSKPTVDDIFPVIPPTAKVPDTVTQQVIDDREDISN
jgi:hypothetical protein